MRRGKIGWFVVIAVLAAAGCVRLGFWQLHRLDERRARNALVSQRLQAPPVDPRALPRDTALVRFRRVSVEGTPDYAHELIYAARTHNGSPGVNLLTPVRLAGTDTTVLVNRGWVFAQDGSTIDTSRTRDPDSVFVGFAEPLPSGPGAAYTSKPNVIARLSYEIVAKALPYPVLPFAVIALNTSDTAAISDTARATPAITRLTVPPLDEGPHLSYAIQWFGFAAVALIGAAIVIKQSRDGRSRQDATEPDHGRGAHDVASGSH